MQRQIKEGNDMEDFQNRGEGYRQELGIDGTAGDAQDVPHLYKEDDKSDGCLACGLSLLASVHKVAEYTDSAAYAFMMAQFQALKDKGEDPTRFEVIFATDEFPKHTTDGLKIERRMRLVKVEDVAGLPIAVSEGKDGVAASVEWHLEGLQAPIASSEDKT